MAIDKYGNELIDGPYCAVCDAGDVCLEWHNDRREWMCDECSREYDADRALWDDEEDDRDRYEYETGARS